MHAVRVLKYDEPGVVIEADAELLAGAAAIGEEPCAERGIYPGAGDDLATQGRRSGSI
jgi:hypothetical protein